MVGIIGSGIAGLGAAYGLAERRIDFEIFEAADRAGGKIQSERLDGFLIEHGPHSLQTSSPLLNRVIEECGLSEHQHFADEAAQKRYVVRRGNPEPLPMSPPALLTSRYFSFGTKLKLAREPFVSVSERSTEESVAAFVRRRLGNEMLDYAVDPFVTGIFAGDPEALALKHAFPALFDLEQNHGSLLRGLIARQKQSRGKAARRIFTFTEGVKQLPDTLSARFKDQLHLNCPIRSIAQDGARWRLELERNGCREFRHLDAIISTVPLPNLKNVDLQVQFDLDALWQVPHPPVSVLALGFRTEDVQHPLDGFGMLVPGRENTRRILGTIFSSTVFPDHAPEGTVLLTTLVGGSRKPDLGRFPKELLLDFVLDDLHDLLGVHGDPIIARHIVWPDAIPQYNLGYGVVKALLNNIEALHTGLYFAGNYRQGISIPDALQSGYDAAQKVKV